MKMEHYTQSQSVKRHGGFWSIWKRKKIDFSKMTEAEALARAARSGKRITPTTFQNSATGALVMTSALAIALGISTAFLAVSNVQLKRENEQYKKGNSELYQQVNTLQRLNSDGIESLLQKTDELKQAIPIKGLFSTLERLIEGLTRVNETNFLYSQRVEEMNGLIQGVNNYSSNPRQIFDEWKLKKRATSNYIPKFPWLNLPIIGDGKQNEVTQDFGNNFYLMFLNEGFHDGFDIINKNDWRIYSPFDGSVIADALSGNRGRTVTLEINQRDEAGYYYRMSTSHLDTRFPWLKSGLAIKKGQQYGIMGKTGFTNGQKYGGEHAHVTFYRSKTKRAGSWDIFDPFENSIFAEEERLVIFFANAPYNIPDSVRVNARKLLE